MRRIMEPLTQMAPTSLQRERMAVHRSSSKGGNLKPIQYFSPVASAQVKSAVLLAGMFASGKTSVTEPAQSRDHTSVCSSIFSSARRKNDLTVSIFGGQTPNHAILMCRATLRARPSGWSLQPHSRNRISSSRTSGSMKPGPVVLGILLRMGAQVHESITNDEPEPVGTRRDSRRTAQRNSHRGKEIPAVIDELPILAVAGALAQGKTVIADAAELRVKETDPPAAIATNLRALGAQWQRHLTALNSSCGQAFARNPPRKLWRSSDCHGICCGGSFCRRGNNHKQRGMCRYVLSRL
jgi:3-phosphoshikimate 1-carboxyvinyltransferase